MQQVDKETILAYAEKYKQIGLNIIPIKYSQKTPIRKWEEFQHRKLSQTEFDTAFGSSEPVNIGVVCGEISGNLVSLDFDDIHNFDRFFPNTKLREEAPIIQSSRGRHVWIRTTQPVKSFSVPELSLDVLGEGKLAIAPPSRHPDGTIYSFLNPNLIEPMQVSDFQNAILERFQALHVKLPNSLTEPNSVRLRLNVGEPEPRRLTQADKDTIVNAIIPFWTRGHRHSMCKYLLGALIKAGLRQVAYHYKKPASFLPRLKGLSGLKEVLDP
jgi:hypothetical protein